MDSKLLDILVCPLCKGPLLYRKPQAELVCKPCRLGYPIKDGRVEIRIADTGVGIPPENLARIFDLYFTTKNGGTGIGLSLVYRTIQLHNGDIDVESTPGVGTTFVIKMPKAGSGSSSSISVSASLRPEAHRLGRL